MGVTAASLCLIQSTAQTIFIFDASQRALVWNPLQHLIKSTAPKPARETVTLLLIVNFALWATNVCGLDIHFEAWNINIANSM